ncbi:MAG: hypothetical protein DMF80_13435 [Acidobacteria bacterium]|nr:MAG: hypothetical protein DMF80_13435 [Acidobacteriota bacterium]
MLAAGILCGRGSAAALADDEFLSPGVTAEFDLDVGDVRCHAISLEAGQLLHVEVREKGPRVLLSLLDDSGTTLVRRQAVFFELPTVRLLAIVPATGTYSLEVRSSGEGWPGGYEIWMDEPRLAADGDRARVAADDAFAEAVRLSAGGATFDEAALKRLDEAEPGFTAAGDRLGQALVMLNRGSMVIDAPTAQVQARGAADLFRALGDRDGEAAALDQLALNRLVEGDVESARALNEANAEYARAVDNRRLLAQSLNGLGLASNHVGQAERAVDFFTQALAAAMAAGSPVLQEATWNCLAIAYTRLGDGEKALESSQRALSLARAMGNSLAVAGALTWLGGLYFQLGEDGKASDALEEALSLIRLKAEGPAEADVLPILAKVLARRGEHARAIEYARRAVQLAREIRYRSGEAESLQILGRNLHEVGQTEEAEQDLREALRIRQSIGTPSGEVRTRAALATVERDRGELREALAQAEAAVTLLGELRSRITNPDLRASFVDVQEDTYGIYLDILMRLHEQDRSAGHDAAALQTSERARARVLLEALIEARADIRQGVPPALLERERALQADMNKASARLSKALAREGAAEAAASARQELERKSDEYRLVQTRIRQESPRYAALTQPEPATVEQIRRDVLDDDTVLLEFYLGDDRSFLWALTRSALVSEALPGRATIEAIARRVHGLMTARQRTRVPAELRTADRQLETASAALSRLLLGGIVARLETDWKGKRLLIVTSGALAYIPFGALPSPVEGSARPLLRDHEIVFAPSASVLLAQRGESRPPPPSGTRVAVLADPVFEASDPRVHVRMAAPTTPAAPSVGLTRAVESLGHGFTRLPFSRAEAGAIAALVPRSSLLEATDFAASRSLVDKGALGDRRIVHFATHGLLDSGHPDLSGLVLSLVDEKGVAQDGFLRMQDIYNLRLPADLVVLSACQTALGREIRGEGLVGLTRGFMYAGARGVVASLWQVDDESTAELMKRFYRAMLKEKRRPADALRAAQLELSLNPRWAAPFYWAGFVLQGEWR